VADRHHGRVSISATRRARAGHEDLVLAELRRSGALSRAELCRRTGLPKTTMFGVVAELLERGAMIEQEAAGPTGRGRGRPAALVALNPSAGLYVGVDVGRRRVRLVIANASHEVVATGLADIAEDAGPEVRAATVVTLVREVARDGGIGLSGLTAVGIGVVGVLGGAASSTPVEAMRRSVGEELGVAVSVGNNSRMAALAEATWGAGRQVDDLVYVRWSTGIGGGFVVGGRAVAGARGGAGEIGHVSVDPNGAPCHCGGRGCLEGLVGGAALLEACAARGLELADLDALVTAAQDLSPVACRVVDAAAARLGRMLAGVVVQLDPQRIVVGGELAQLGSLVLDPVRDAIGRLALPLVARPLDVVQADLGVNAAALGALALLLREEEQPA